MRGVLDDLRILAASMLEEPEIQYHACAVLLEVVIAKHEPVPLDRDDTRPRLTTRQRQVLDYIVEIRRGGDGSPTYRAIAEHFGWSSTNAVGDHVEALERKGYLERERGKSCSLRPVRYP